MPDVLMSPRVIRIDGGLNLGVDTEAGVPRVLVIGTAGDGPEGIPTEVTTETAIDLFGNPDHGTLVKGIYEVFAGVYPASTIDVYAYRVVGWGGSKAYTILQGGGVNSLKLAYKYSSAVGNGVTITGRGDGTGFDIYDPGTGQSHFVSAQNVSTATNRDVAEVAAYINAHGTLGQFMSATAVDQTDAHWEMILDTVAGGLQGCVSGVDYAYDTNNKLVMLLLSGSFDIANVETHRSLDGIAKSVATNCVTNLQTLLHVYKFDESGLGQHNTKGGNSMVLGYMPKDAKNEASAGHASLLCPYSQAAADVPVYENYSLNHTTSQVLLNAMTPAAFTTTTGGKTVDYSKISGANFVGHGFKVGDTITIASAAGTGAAADWNGTHTITEGTEVDFIVIDLAYPGATTFSGGTVDAAVPSANHEEGHVVFQARNVESEWGLNGTPAVGSTDLIFVLGGLPDDSTADSLTYNAATPRYNTDGDTYQYTINTGYYGAFSAAEALMVDGETSYTKEDFIVEYKLPTSSAWVTLLPAYITVASCKIWDYNSTTGNVEIIIKLDPTAADYPCGVTGVRFRCSCDTAAVELVERSTKGMCTGTGMWRNYFMAGNVVTFGAALPHHCILRTATVEDIEEGSGVSMELKDNGSSYNACLRFDAGTAPDKFGRMGLNYEWVAPLPTWSTTPVTLTGGQHGTKLTDFELKIQLGLAYDALRLFNRSITVVKGAYVDSESIVANEETGLPETAYGIYYDDLITHLDEISGYYGDAWGIMDVTPISGAVTDTTLWTHVRNLYEVDTGSSSRAANYISTITSDRLILCDLPSFFRHPRTNVPYIAGGAAALAGLAASKPTQIGIINQKFVGSIGPAYDVGRFNPYMEVARINCWQPRGDGDIVISDHLTMAIATSDYKYWTTGQIAAVAVDAFRLPALAMYGRGMDAASRAAFETEAIASLNAMMEPDMVTGIGPALLGFHFKMISTPAEAVRGRLRYKLYLTPTPIAREIEIEVVLQPPTGAELGTTDVTASVA